MTPLHQPKEGSNMNDLFLRRAYTYKGISVIVEIDLINKTISLVDKHGDNKTFSDKNWYFTGRELKYMNGWLLILDAMKYAITEASKVLEEAEARNEKAFVKLLMNVNDNLDTNPRVNLKKTKL